MDMTLITIVLTTHWLADFFLQPQKLALNKYKLKKEFFLHILIYTASLFPLTYASLSDRSIYEILFFNIVGVGFFHGIVDAITSQTNRFFWKLSDKRWFFCSIGADQLLHTLHLIFLFGYVINY